MSLTITFTSPEVFALADLYVDLADGGEAGALAEGRIVTLLSQKIGEQML